MRQTQGSALAPVVALTGPTATGKSDLGIRLAIELGGEVVGADASQFYRGMDIGTAKLSPHEQRGITHHQIDVLDLSDDANVATYQVNARADLAQIRDRSKVPIVVGGSGLYVRALLDRLEIPPTDADVRKRWEGELERIGAEALHDLLGERDPQAAASIGRRNARRVVRALEAIELTGRPFSATMPTREFIEPTVLLGLRADRELLGERIGRRAAGMWEKENRGGLLAEVQALEEQGLRQGKTASRAVGYAQALRQLDGELSEAEAIQETAIATRQLARRQVAWWRPDPRVIWLEHDAPDLFDQAIAQVRSVSCRPRR